MANRLKLTEKAHLQVGVFFIAFALVTAIAVLPGAKEDQLERDVN